MATETPIEYYAGLVDAQLNVSLAKTAAATRVTLTSTDPRVAEELATKFRPVRTTIVRRPDKKDACTMLFTGELAKPVLEFAAEHCVLKKDLAAKTLEYLNGTGSEDAVKAAGLPEAVDDVSLDWASGFFDVRSEIVAADPEKKKRASVRLPLPKAERFIIPALQKVLHGKCKKPDPTRLVYDTKDSIKLLMETVDGHVRVKASDLGL